MATAEKLSAKAAAIEIGTDARTLRKFLRSDDCPLDPVGQGNRYEFTKGEVKKLKKLFIAWSGSSKKTKTTAKNIITSEDVIADEDEVEEIDLDLEEDIEEDDPEEDIEEDELEDLDPTDDDIEDLDDEDLEILDLDD